MNKTNYWNFREKLTQNANLKTDTCECKMYVSTYIAHIHIYEEIRFRISKAGKIDTFSGPFKPWNTAFDELYLLSKSDQKSLRSSEQFHLFDSIDSVLKTDWNSTNSLNCSDACCVPGWVPGNNDSKMKEAYALPWDIS